MSDMPVLRAGHAFEAPDGGGYILRADLHFMQPVDAKQLEPFGGAPVLEYGGLAPEWLMRQLAEEARKQFPLDFQPLGGLI